MNKKKMLILLFVLIISTFILSACGGDSAQEEINLLDSDWESIEELAQGQELNFYMWGGDERINQWVDNYAAQRLKELYDIELNRVPMGPNDYLNQLLAEKQADRDPGSIDLLWINGENFITAMNNDLLFGPFVDQIPNYHKYMDTDSYEITRDFGYPTDGYEIPWGKAQFTFIYDKARTENPPYTFAEFENWIKDNPGQFTYPAPPNFTGSVFLRHIIYEVTGGHEQYQNIESESELREKIRPAMEYLRDLKPYLWREGETYPATTAQLNNMFVDGELMATMAYSTVLASGEIESGNFPATVRTFVLENGTIANTHFLAIPFNAPNKAAAMVGANFLTSFEAQLEKFDPQKWGDLPVFSYEKLSEEEQQQVDNIDLGVATLEQEVLDSHSLPEMPAEFIPIIEEEWEKIIGQ
ncbi:ABC transporter substrate-binding protein [Halanaerobium sp. Z-7514]|uniref:ABC transporter substrate-binding protein n=1 Tax=Halanaerobium polyolivorans TaxID=2886943 RepID=A0AAW4WVR3_9FIRM|nr:ABC transporter substrate-binding protein [Halanaerobium polyolivorans]MCC3144650.1 ABC transporter substrate-binding protein [Halanaerobium polyolivorans]